MIYATASTWAQDIKHRLSNVPLNIEPLASLIGVGGYICFAAAGIMLWLDQTRSAFAALASLVIFVIGLISVRLFNSAACFHRAAAESVVKQSLRMTHHAAE